MSVAVVTGATRGIGRATALGLASDGFDVVATYHRDADGAQTTVDMIRGAGGSAVAHRLDVTQPASTTDLFGRLRAERRVPGVVVSNAGAVDNALVMTMTDDQFSRVIDTCLYGSFAVFRAALPMMLRQRGGRLIAVSSAAGVFGLRGAANYAAAKAGIHGLVRSLAIETGRWAITVNAVAPGVIESGGQTRADPAIVERKLERIALGRAGTCEEVAAVIRFLASPAASYVTGQIVLVDGGIAP
jgi:3-oxoacyl-[acyl-carrier protein] reductase